MNMKENSVKWQQVLIWAVVTFVAVCLVFIIYIYSYERIGSERFPSLSGETALTIFQGTFGLAAALLIAFVAVVLANSSLEISKRQSLLVENQARLELETRLLQIRYGAPEIGQQAIFASQEVIQAINRLVMAGTGLAANLKVAEDEYAWTLYEKEREDSHDQADSNECSADQINGFSDEYEEYIYSEDPLRSRRNLERRKLYERAVSEINQSVLALTGFILRYPNKTERDSAITRHFGSFFDHLLSYAQKMCEANVHFQEDEAAYSRLIKINQLAPDPEFRTKLLGYLSGFEHIDLSGYKEACIPPQTVCENLSMEIAAGRFHNLEDAFDVLSSTIPSMYIYFNELDRIDFSYILALAATAIDLSNPFRAALHVEAELSGIIDRNDIDSLRLKRVMMESIRNHINVNVPYASCIFNVEGRDQVSDYAWIKMWRDDGANAEFIPKKFDIEIYK